MRRLFRTVAVLLLCGALSSPVIEARGRNNNNTGSPVSTPTHNSRGEAPSRPGGGTQGNPGNRPGGGNQGNPGGNPGGGTQGNPGNRPGSGGNGSQTGRPNNNPTPQRPNNHGGNNPGGNPGGGNPGNNPGVGNIGGNPGGGPGNYRPNPGSPGTPGGGYKPNAGMPAPGRPNWPMMPTSRPFQRPVPPAGYRPHYTGPSIGTILGITLGTALNISLNHLINNGYTVAGYGNNAVYLDNVYQLNMLWPNAILYYTNGCLTNSEFVYSTPYYDPSRYQTAFNMICGNYGQPYSVQNLYGGGMQATWFGYNGQFIQLSLQQQNAYNGMSRFYTTLSFGN